MWRKNVSVLIGCIASLSAMAQSAENMERILRLTGCESPESLDGYEAERLCAYIERPLKINAVSVSRLRSSGLLSQYQVASLSDYRSRHGDVMSLAELASVDGFTSDFVQVLAPFISLEGADIRAYGNDGGKKTFSDLAVRGGVNLYEENAKSSYGFKYRCEIGNAFSVALASSRASTEGFGPPELHSGYIAWEPDRIPLKIVAGDFNARFGQGLALWNGFSMSGFSRMSSFSRSSSGISPSWSFTGGSAMTGVAGEYSVSGLRISSFIAFPEIKNRGGREIPVMPAVNIGWYGRNVCASFTHYLEIPLRIGEPYIPDMKTSADISMCVRGTDIFSEFVFDWVAAVPAVLAGMSHPLKENMRMALHLRYYPSAFNPSRSAAPVSGTKCNNEYGASFCLEMSSDTGRHKGSVSFDSAYLPVPKKGDSRSMHFKILAEGEFAFSEAFVLKARLSERYRTWERRFKTDARADIVWSSSRFKVTGRLNAVRCVATSFLGYLEGGYDTEKLSVYLRLGAFRADNWDDRIYVYERDAPGSFSVPAFYGRGAWLSLTGRWNFAPWGRIYLRMSKKPGNAGLKLQFMFSF